MPFLQFTKEGIENSGSKEFYINLLSDFYKLIDIKSIKIDVTLSSAHIAIDGINDGKIIVPCINKETIKYVENYADIVVSGSFIEL